MAETKLEKRIIKIGDNEYLLDDFLKLHAEQENNFYNFAKQRGQFTDEALNELRTAISDRINAIKSGKSFDVDGSMEGDLVDNITYQVKEKKGLRKSVKDVSQNKTTWAQHYLSQIAKYLKPYEKSKASGGWDISKHGIGAYLTGQGLNAQDVFEKYDLRDENNPDAPRTNAKRRELLKQHLAGYKNWLASKGFDFTANNNDWDDNFGTDFDKFVTDYDNLDNNALTAALRKFGAGDAYTTAFTSTDWNLADSDKTSEERETAEKERKAKEEQEKQIKAHNDAVTSYWDIYSALNPQSANMTAYLGQSNSNFYRTPEEILEWGRNTKGINIDDYQKRYNENKWDAEAAQYILPIMQANGRLKETTIDGVKYVYDPQTIDRNNHSFIAIDPISGKMELKFLYDIEEESKQLRNKYLQAQGASKYHIDPESHKEGGILHMQTGGNFDAMLYLQSLDNSDYEKRSKEQGITAKQLKESERKPLGEDTIIDNSLFTGNDFVLLATMATNIGSMFLDPVTGGLVGAGASTVDFVNDINRDGFQGKDAWNYVKNLGMDALGMLPVIGDTFGTLGKVKKGLFQLAPKIIGYLGMALGIMNSPQIIDSFTKILDEREMTAADWQNIANGINLIISGSRVGKHAVKNARAKQASVIPDKLQVEVTNKRGESKLLVLDGDNAKAVRDSDHSVESINKIIKDIDGMQDYEVTPKSSVFDFSLKMPGRKVKNEATGSESRVWNPFESKTKKANVSEVYDPVKFARAYRGKNPNVPYSANESKNLSEKRALDLYGDKNQVDASGKINLETWKQQQQTQVDDFIRTTKEKAKKYAERTNEYKSRLESTNQKITDTESNINTENTNYSNLETNLDNQKLTVAEIIAARNNPERKSAAQAIILNRRLLEAKLQELNKLKNKPIQKNKDKRKINTLTEEIKQLQKVIDDDFKILSNSTKGKLKEAKQNVTNTEGEMSRLNVEINKLQELLNRLNSHKSSLETRVNTHGSAFNQLINFEPEIKQFNGVDYTFGKKLTESELLNEGLFKQGGTINRNKINKFLNYAKG